MEKEDVKKLLTVLKVNYPNSFSRLSNEETYAYLDLWAEAFKDDPTELVVSAVKSIIYGDPREFAPNIAQVKEKMYSIVNRDEMTEQEAWNRVKQAIGRSGYYSNEEYDKLPPILQKLVGSPRQLFDWSQMDSDELNTVIASNFMRSYKTRSRSEKEYQMLPNDIKMAIESSIKFIGDGQK